MTADDLARGWDVALQTAADAIQKETDADRAYDSRHSSGRVGMLAARQLVLGLIGKAPAESAAMPDPDVPPALLAALEGKNSEIKRHHLDARVGDLQGSRVQAVRDVLDQWAPAEGTSTYELWLQVQRATKLHADEIAAIQAEGRGEIPGISGPGAPQ